MLDLPSYLLSSSVVLAQFLAGWDLSGADSTVKIVDVLTLGGYRIVALLVGFGFAVLGYRLFLRGVFERAGDLKAAWGDKNLILKQASPGTFFALFGAFIIAVTILSKFEIERGAGVPNDVQSILAKVITEVELTPEEKSRLSAWIGSSSGWDHMIAGDPGLKELLKVWNEDAWVQG